MGEERKTKKKSKIVTLLQVIGVILIIVNLIPENKREQAKDAIISYTESSEAEEFTGKIAESDRFEEFTEEIAEKEEVESEESKLGYPQEEKWIAEFGFDMEWITTEDSLLYVYHSTKLAYEKKGISSLDDLYSYFYEENLFTGEVEYTSSAYVLDTFVWSDADFYNELFDILGNGNHDKGLEIYSRASDELYEAAQKEYEEIINPKVVIDYVFSLENYLHDFGSYTKEDVYQIISDAYTSSDEYTDMRTCNQDVVNDLMRDNESNIGRKVILEGTVKTSDGNRIKMLDSSVDMNYNGYNLWTTIDVSLLPVSIFEGDKVTIYAVYTGMVHQNDGGYRASFTAIDAVIN